MTTSGTYAWNPSAGDLLMNAYAQCLVPRTALTPEHWVNAGMAFNLLMVDLSNRNPHQWALETVSQALSASTAEYTLANRVLAIAIAYIDTADEKSRVIGPISATEYGAIPDKTTEGPPTSYWFNLQAAAPVITLYPVPDEDSTYTLKLMAFRQLQDVAVSAGQTPDAPYRYLDAITTGLASRLAEIYPDALVKAKGQGSIDRLHAQYEAKYNLAARRDQENTPLFVTPGLSSYFR